MTDKTKADRIVEGVKKGLEQGLKNTLADMKACVDGRCEALAKQNDAIEKKLQERIAALEAKLGETKDIDEKLAVLEKKLVGCVGNECAYIRSSIQTLQDTQAQAQAQADAKAKAATPAATPPAEPAPQPKVTPPAPKKKAAPPPEEEEEEETEEDDSEFHCPTCGVPIKEGVTDCQECGEKIKWQEREEP